MGPDTREFVHDRAQGRCEYCHLPDAFDEWPFHVEHIVAKQHGGGDNADNLCWACKRCNLRKGTNLSSIDPQSRRRSAIYDPRRQNWHDHFAVRDAVMVGLAATGRATVNPLRMNDHRRVDLRRQLIEDGLFQI